MRLPLAILIIAGGAVMLSATSTDEVSALMLSVSTPTAKSIILSQEKTLGPYSSTYDPNEWEWKEIYDALYLSHRRIPDCLIASHGPGEVYEGYKMTVKTRKLGGADYTSVRQYDNKSSIYTYSVRSSKDVLFVYAGRDAAGCIERAESILLSYETSQKKSK